MTHAEKHPALLVHSAEPYNAGPPPALLIEHPITPVDRFYVRNHGTVPAATDRLTVDGLVARPLELTLAELRERFASITVGATLQCAGNRRTELLAVRPIPGELPWQADAIGTAEWRGVRLMDVLAAAGILPGAAHAAFTGQDAVERHGHTFGFGGSLPLDRALAPEVILAYAMNGAPLPEIHGGPLRVIAPGVIGARSVKWLSRITLQAEPSANYFQQHAYKLFPPDVTAATVDWTSGTMLEQTALNAVICQPEPDARLAAGPVVARGYALGCGGAPIARVELSADDGATWQPAELDAPPRPNCWSLWSIRLDLPPGKHTLIVRATDRSGTTQPADAAALWNVKGYMNNAWHRVPLTVA